MATPTTLGTCSSPTFEQDMTSPAEAPLDLTSFSGTGLPVELQNYSVE